MQKQKNKRVTKRIRFWYVRVPFLLIGCLMATEMVVRANEKEQEEEFDWLLSEIMYDPRAADGDNEWMEVYAGEDIELELTRSGEDKYVLPVRVCDRHDFEKEKCAESHPVYYSKEKLTLEKGALFIVAQDKGQFKEQCPDFSGVVLGSNFSLSNKAENNHVSLVLKREDKEDKELDALVYASSWGGNDNGKSLERENYSKKNERGNWTESQFIGGSPGEKYKRIEVEYSKKISINEIYPAPLKDEDEWIELFNSDDKEVDLEGWAIKDKSGKQLVFSSKEIAAGKYEVIKGKELKLSLNNDGDELQLFNPASELVQKVSYGKVLSNGISWSYRGKEKYDWTEIATPGKDNEFDRLESYPEGVIINEVLSNPKGTDKNHEWVELRNLLAFPVNLKGWKIQNSNKRAYVIGDFILAPSSYGKVAVKNSTFTLKNTDEDVFLLDPNGERKDFVAILGSAKENISYNRTEKKQWRWSRFLTPGKKNRLNSAPDVAVRFDKEAYKDIYASFDASGTEDKDDDNLKYVWDFGDGHKSYLAATKHKYEKNGRYKVILRVNDGSETVAKELNVKVVSFPRAKLSIVRLDPNPVGKDSGGGEQIEIVNSEKKELDLKGYGIATGREKNKLTNHPISESLPIKSGEKIILKNNLCKFSLINSGKAIVALKAPNGKELDVVEYEKPNGQSVAEGEYLMFQSGNWQWIQTAGEDSAATPARVAASVEVGSAATDNADPFAAAIFTLFHNEEESICQTLESLRLMDWSSDNEYWLRWVARDVRRRII